MYNHEYLKNFTKSIFIKIGCPENDAQIIADVLMAAELRGIPSHGLIRVNDYIGMYERNRINVKPKIKIVHETPSTAVIDGDNCFGMVAAKASMEKAIKMAQSVGTGWVSTRNSNHYGIAGYYAMMALEKDMIGISMTNANPLVAPTWSLSRFLGTNPIAVAIPAGKQPPFVADFATTPIARGKLNVMAKSGKKAPFGYVQDSDGNPSDKPDILEHGGAILPLGGDYEHGSHKGYSLAAIVDIFTAVLSGANFGPFVPPQIPYLPYPENQPGKGLGHFFGAMRIDAFQNAEDFKNYMDKWIETFRSAKPAKDYEKVLIPGDPERKNEKYNLKNGITLLPVVIKQLTEIGDKYQIPFKPEKMNT
ncbi:MAG: Ldh family oxidoreductase [Marinilabiliales bacterium]